MSTLTITPLRQRMIEDMSARKLGRHSQRSHIYSCERFAAFLKRSPDTATADDVRRFQMHLVEWTSIVNRNRIMTGVKFLFRVTLRRHDLAAEIYHLKEPQRLPLIMSPGEANRLLTMADKLKVQVMLALAYGCGLRSGEVVRLKAGDIDSAQNIIRIVQSKGRKDPDLWRKRTRIWSIRLIYCGPNSWHGRTVGYQSAAQQAGGNPRPDRGLSGADCSGQARSGSRQRNDPDVHRRRVSAHALRGEPRLF
jgi:integrase